MKILFINTVNLDRNGITTFILNNTKYLSKTNSVSVLSSKVVNSSITDILLANNINFIKLPNRYNKPLRYFFGLIKVIRDNKYDIVHVNGNSSTMVIELLAAKLAGCNCRISHAHNTATEHKVIHNLLYPFFNISLTARMACSASAGKWLYKGKDFYIINNGVDLSEYIPKLEVRNAIRKKYGIKDSELLLGNIGIFNFQKNQRFLISIMKKLDKKYKLLLIGEGPLQEQLEKTVNNFHLNSRVIFSGKVNNVNDYLSAIDIFLMPSKFEGLPFALVEAQASALECLVSNNISKESNLTGNVHYVSLDSIDDWVNKILIYTKYYSFKERLALLNGVHQEIRNNGYDAQQNAKYLEKIFKQFCN